MLILTRRPSEAIYIGNEIVVTVLGVIGNQVRVGIEAPRSIAVDRAEVHVRKKQQKEQAARVRDANGDVDGNVAGSTAP